MASWFAYNKKVVASCLCIVGLLFLVAGIIIGAVLTDHVLKNAFYDRLKFNESDTGETCEIEDWNFYFFNITNIQPVFNGAYPIFQQVGPYNYTRKTCIFDRKSNETLQTYRQYWELPVLKDNSVRKETDIITNFNPGYLALLAGVTEKLKTSGRDSSDPELGLLVNLLPSVLGQVITGMQSPTFTTSIKSQGVAGAYSLVLAQLIPVANKLVRAKTGINYIKNISSSVGGEFFINNDTQPYGVNAVTGNTELFSSQSVNKILWSLTPPYGWFVDTTYFSGFLAFVSSAENNTLKATFKALYNISENQYNVLLGYSNVVVLNAIPEAYFGNNATISAIATNLFYEQWANGTVLPFGVDLTNDGNTTDYFEVGMISSSKIVASNISLATSKALWNATNPLSFVNSSGILFWLSAATNITNYNTLTVDFGLSNAQITMILTWIGRWLQFPSVEAAVLARLSVYCQCNVTSIAQLPYLQWGAAGALVGDSIRKFDPVSFPIAPEFAKYAESVNSTIRFTPQKSQEILSGTYGLLNGSNAANYLGYLSTASTNPMSLVTLQVLYGISPGEAILLGNYLLYFTNSMVRSVLLGVVFRNNSGIFTSRHPLEILLTGQDNALIFLQQDSMIGALYHDYQATTRAEALAQEPYIKNVYHGGNDDALRKGLEKEFYFGDPYLYNYAQPVKVSGNDGGENWVPYSLTKEDKLIIWSDVLVRTAEFEFWQETETKGINTWKFRLSDSNLLSSAEDASKALYYQRYHGLFNITAYNPFEVFFGKPHFFGVETNLTKNIAVSINNTDPHFMNWWISIEPESGITMEKSTPGQVSYGIHSYPRFYPNIKPGVYPIFWKDDTKVITDEDAMDFKDKVNGLKGGSLAAWIVLPFIALIFFAAALFTCIRVPVPLTFSEDKESDKSIPMTVIKSEKKSSKKVEIKQEVQEEDEKPLKKKNTEKNEKKTEKIEKKEPENLGGSIASTSNLIDKESDKKIETSKDEEKDRTTKKSKSSSESSTAESSSSSSSSSSESSSESSSDDK